MGKMKKFHTIALTICRHAGLVDEDSDNYDEELDAWATLMSYSFMCNYIARQENDSDTVSHNELSDRAKEFLLHLETVFMKEGSNRIVITEPLPLYMPDEDAEIIKELLLPGYLTAYVDTNGLPYLEITTSAINEAYRIRYSIIMGDVKANVSGCLEVELGDSSE